MKRAYRYITFADRQRIEGMHSAGERAEDIAGRTGVSTAAIYRELKRGETGAEDANCRPAYSAEAAQRRLQESFRRRGRKVSRREEECKA